MSRRTVVESREADSGGQATSLQWIAPCVIVVTLAAATLLSSDVPGDSSTNRPLAVRLFTLPILFPEPMDIRDYALPMGLCVLLLLQAASIAKRVGRGPAWFDVVAGGALILAIGSSVVNDSWELSRGWVFHFATGILWARAVAECDLRSRALWIGAAAVAVGGAFLTFWTQREIGMGGLDIPIGPVTLTAGLAALWSAVALAYLPGCIAERGVQAGRKAWSVFVCVMVLLASFWLLTASNRRGAWLGSAVAVVFLVCVWLWPRVPRRVQRIGTVLALLGFVGACGAVLVRSRTPDLRMAVSYGVRMLYVGKSTEMLATKPMLGYGPDMFVCRMTEELSPLRSHRPRVLQGLIDETAHNEWVQATFELGLLGGLMYACMPLGAIAAALRMRNSNAGSGRERLALATGLVAVVAMEATSINLRYNTLPVWYWTIIGLLLSHGERRTCEPRTVGARVGAIALAFAIFGIGLSDARNSNAHARARVAMANAPERVSAIFADAGPRMGAVKWMQCEYDRGLALMNSASVATEKRGDAVRDAVRVFERIHRDWPAHPDPVAQLARCHLFAGDAESARRVLSEYIEKRNPFEPQCNLLLAETPGTTAVQQRDCFVRALREADCDENLLRLLDRVEAAGGFAGDWILRVLAADNMLTNRDTSTWADSLEPETLRAESIRLSRAGRWKEAAQSAKLAAMAYETMYRSRSTFSRTAPAIADAQWKCAEFLFLASPAQTEEPVRMIREAEKSLIRGIDDVYGPQGDSDVDWMAGPGLPEDVPDRFRAMFAMSAVIHIAAGKAENLDARVAYCIPPEQRNSGTIRTQRSMCAREVIRIFQNVPVESRPESLKKAAQWAAEGAG